VAGLLERKKRATRIAIRDAGMTLFASQGFTATTIDQIAEAADVSRATVFGYFPTKEELVFGDGAAVIELLDGRLRERGDQTTLAVVRTWLGELAGWFEPELVLQQRLAREVPVVGARRLQLFSEAERAIADSLEAELGAEQPLAARLAAAALAQARAEQLDHGGPVAEDELLLGRVVAEHRRAGDVGRLGDLVDRRGREALAGEQVHRGIAQRDAGRALLPLPEAGHGAKIALRLNLDSVDF
jgi:AcrR family transcriptional regulator